MPASRRHTPVKPRSLFYWEAKRRLELLVAVENLASRRVAEKVGATFEGVLPAGPRGQGELHNDTYCFSLIRR